MLAGKISFDRILTGEKMKRRKKKTGLKKKGISKTHGVREHSRVDGKCTLGLGKAEGLCWDRKKT